MSTPRVAVAVLGCAASLLAIGCGDGGDSPTATATTAGRAAVGTATVNIASFKFVPASVTLTAGGSVTWVNRDKAPHTAENTGEAAPDEFATGRLTRGERRSITFSEPGSYTYYCIYHRFMEATITVR